MDFILNGAPIQSLIMNKDQKRYETCQKPKSKAVLKIVSQTGIPFHSPNAGLSEAQIVDQINAQITQINVVEIGQDLPEQPQIFQLMYSDSKIRITDYSKQESYYLLSYQAIVPIALCSQALKKDIGGLHLKLPLYPQSFTQVEAQIEILRTSQ